MVYVVKGITPISGYENKVIKSIQLVDIIEIGIRSFQKLQIAFHDETWLIMETSDAESYHSELIVKE